VSIQEDIELAFTGGDLPQIEERLQQVLSLVDSGEIRAVEKTDAGWVTNGGVRAYILDHSSIMVTVPLSPSIVII